MREDPFRAVYDEHYDAVRRTLACLGVGPATLEDAIQEVFLVIHRRLAMDPSQPIARPWVYGVVRRVAWRQHRALQRTDRRDSFGDPPCDRTSPDRTLEEKEAVAFVYDFLDQLDDDQREAFVLLEIEGLTAKVVAEIVGASPNTVSSRLRLARAKFAAAIDGRTGRIEEVGDGR